MLTEQRGGQQSRARHDVATFIDGDKYDAVMRSWQGVYARCREWTQKSRGIRIQSSTQRQSKHELPHTSKHASHAPVLSWSRTKPVSSKEPKKMPETPTRVHLERRGALKTQVAREPRVDRSTCDAQDVRDCSHPLCSLLLLISEVEAPARHRLGLAASVSWAWSPARRHSHGHYQRGSQMETGRRESQGYFPHALIRGPTPCSRWGRQREPVPGMSGRWGGRGARSGGVR